jgi:AraC-type DNA-binding domain-containing proteins
MDLDIAKASEKLAELDIKFSSGEFKIEVIWFRVFTAAGSWNIRRHKHSTYEFHFIAEGSCIVRLDNTEFTVKAGEFYLTAPGVYHEQVGIGQYGLTEYSLNCDIDLQSDSPSEAAHLLDILNSTLCSPFEDTTGIIALFNNALEEAYHKCTGFLNTIRSLIIQIIVMSARAIEVNSDYNYNLPLKNKKEEHRYAQIVQYIEDNISSPITIKDIASFMFISEKQIYRIVKQFRNMSAKELVIDIKLKSARELLKTSNLSLAEISDSLGFSSEFYFNQLFRKKEGYPPGLYRYNNKNVQKP